MIKRLLQSKIENWLFKQKVIVLYGARQVGKTTLTQQILRDSKKEAKYFNCDLESVKASLETQNQELLKSFIGNAEIVAFDEAQRVENIGLILKILHDTFPEIQIIATGSSSFDLANKVSEPLTGRSIQFMLYPLSLEEIAISYDQEIAHSSLDRLLRYGAYPKVFTSSEDEAITELESIANNYLYKDILSFEKIRKSQLVSDLLQLLSLQLGSEVNYTELATTLGVDRLTIQNYIDLLEKNFVIFKLRAFNRNLRKEVAKSFKVYFYDLGIRNILIKNFNSLKLRNDVGALWENFCVAERMKWNQAHSNLTNTYFWRTYTQKEIDYIEETGGKLHAYEFKWGQNSKVKTPTEFLESYPESTFRTIHSSNYQQFLLK
jgi:predicted AAA+ superfamily ATPase